MTTNKNLLLLIFFTYGVFFKSYAQDNPSTSQTVTIEIDLDNGEIKGPLPIDEFIDLKIISNSNSLNVDENPALIRFRYNLKRKKVPVRKRKFNLAQSNPEKNRSLYYLTQKPELEKKKEGLYTAQLRPYIVPNASYDFIFRKIFNTAQKKIFFEIINLISEQKIVKAIELYETKLEIIEKELVEREIPIRVLPEFSDLLKVYPQIEKQIKSFQNLDEQYPKFTQKEVEQLSDKYLEYKMDLKNYTNITFEYLQPVNNGLKDIVVGVRKFAKTKTSKSWDYISKAENMESNLKLFQNFQEDIRKILILNPSDKLISKIYKNKVLVMGDLLKKNYKALTDDLKDLFEHNILYPGPESKDPKTARKLKNFFCFGQIITVNSASSNDENSSITYLVADVGIMNSWVSDQLGDTRYLGRLYFGLNWHPWGFNKKLRFKNAANKRLSYITSFAIGVTVGEIDELGHTDLFNNISPTLGANVKLLSDVRFGIGAIALRRNRNPIVDDEKMVIRPYVSLSFDLKILKDLLFFKTITNSQQ